jgi:hypothetical protein
MSLSLRQGIAAVAAIAFGAVLAPAAPAVPLTASAEQRGARHEPVDRPGGIEHDGAI